MKRILQIFFLFMFFMVGFSLLIVQKYPLTTKTIPTNSTPYAEEFSEKLQATNFTKKVLQAIRKAGYAPDSTVSYLVDSPEQQVITIQLNAGEEIDVSTESEIQSIIDELAKKNHIPLLMVHVQLQEAE